MKQCDFLISFVVAVVAIFALVTTAESATLWDSCCVIEDFTDFVKLIAAA